MTVLSGTSCLITTPISTPARKEVMKMGITKNLMIDLYPDAQEESEDYPGSDLDDFLKSRQADEPIIHQPAVVKNRNLLVEF